jgi:hypothetical protein
VVEEEEVNGKVWRNWNLGNERVIKAAQGVSPADLGHLLWNDLQQRKEAVRRL